jgi:hypothetical protein
LSSSDAIKWSAQLVAHRGQKIAFQAVEFKQAHIGLRQLVDLEIEI